MDGVLTAIFEDGRCTIQQGEYSAHDLHMKALSSLYQLARRIILIRRKRRVILTCPMRQTMSKLVADFKDEHVHAERVRSI